MPSPQRALVIGGSIGGLFAAQFLRQAGWDVAIFERSAGDLADRGAGLNTSAELFDAMRAIGTPVSPDLAFHVRSSAWLRQDDTIGVEIPRGWHGSTWGTIYRPLRAAFPSALYHAGKAVERVEQNGDGVVAFFADGTRERGDLLIAADGVYSTIRKQFLPDLAPTPAGYIAWRGILDEKDLPRRHRRCCSSARHFRFRKASWWYRFPCRARITTCAVAIAVIISSGTARHHTTSSARSSPTQPASITACPSRRRSFAPSSSPR